MHDFVDLRVYGGRRAVLRSFLYGASARLGGATKYRRIDWSQVGRLVFVCRGNICRSPFAAEVARRRGIEAASVGIEAESGVSAAPDAIHAAADFGVDLSMHRACRANDFELNARDLVVGFEPSHVFQWPSASTSAGCQVTLLAAWLRHPNLYIHDPYGTNEAYFHSCFLRVDEAVAQLCRRMSVAEPYANR